MAAGRGAGPVCRGFAGAGTSAYHLSTLEKIVETSQDATIYVHYCTGDVMRRISPDAQGIAAVGNAESMHAGADDVELGKNGRAPQIAAFWQVRDPGNAGTVIRAADAAGCDAVIFVDDCVDVLNPKVIRSTAGSCSICRYSP